MGDTVSWRFQFVTNTQTYGVIKNIDLSKPIYSNINDLSLK